MIPLANPEHVSITQLSKAVCDQWGRIHPNSTEIRVKRIFDEAQEDVDLSLCPEMTVADVWIDRGKARDGLDQRGTVCIISSPMGDETDTHTMSIGHNTETEDGSQIVISSDPEEESSSSSEEDSEEEDLRQRVRDWLASRASRFHVNLAVPSSSEQEENTKRGREKAEHRRIIALLRNRSLPHEAKKIAERMSFDLRRMTKRSIHERPPIRTRLQEDRENLIATLPFTQ